MEATTEGLSLIPTSKRDAGSQPQDLLIREWFVILAEAFDYTPSDSLVNIWIMGLGHHDPQLLAVAFKKILKTWKPEFGRRFPVVADIDSQIAEAQEKSFEVSGELEWQKLLAWIRDNVFPDTGLRRGAPQLAPAVWHAAKAAGGVYFLESCSEQDLVFRKRDFVAAYRNVAELDLVQELLGTGAAKSMLAQLAAGPPQPERKQFQRATEPEGKLPPRGEVRRVLDVVARGSAPAEMSLAEIQRRAEEQKRLLTAAGFDLNAPAPTVEKLLARQLAAREKETEPEAITR